LAQLVALGAFAVAGNVTVGTTLGAFYLGNGAAFVVALVLLVRTPGSRASASEHADHEQSARAVVAFSLWLTVATLAMYVVTLAPRAILARSSYRDVAVFDFALLLYTIPQRFVASFVTALVPLAAQRKRLTLRAPGRLDVAVAAIATGIGALALHATHAVPALLSVLGLERYRGAETLMLVLLLGAPGELFFGFYSALLQASGRSRLLARFTWTTAVVAGLAMAVAADAGPVWVAGIVSLAYWSLYFQARRAVGDAVNSESRVVARFAHLLRITPSLRSEGAEG
jgi:O-antigen/teichoic acid export membrane protein